MLQRKRLKINSANNFQQIFQQNCLNQDLQD